MELERSRERFAEQGLGVAAISYDSRDVLSHFARRLGIGYSLLSDPDSEVIRAFGILNTNVPRGHEWYGVPFPGTYIVDETGRVTAKYFEEGHRQRTTAETVLVKQLGAEGGRQIEVKTRHLTASAFASQDRVRPGNRITLALDIDLPPKMHLYAPGVQGYKPVSFVIDSPHVWAHALEFPKPEILHLPVIEESVPVYHGSVRISRDITNSPQFREQRLEIPGSFEYQACDNRVCYRPERVPLVFELALEHHDRERVPQELRRQSSEAPR